MCANQLHKIGRMLIVYRYRVKSQAGLLNKQARAVNYVFNYCNETQKHALKWGKRWPSGFDLNKLTSGASKELGLHSGTVNAVCEQYAKSRSEKKRPFLRWRSHKRSLGWVPLKGRDVKETPGGFHFHGREFKVFKSRDLPAGAKIKDGTNFAQDARGNWFLNVCIEIADGEVREVQRGVGIDLGLKDFATLSTGEKINNLKHLRQLENKLGHAQRAGKKRLAANVHAKIANRHKAIRHGAKFEEVNEAWSTQTCNACGVIAGPKGRAGLNERNWICGCGAKHDRDVNAARNILRRGSGHGTPVEGIPVL